MPPERLVWSADLDAEAERTLENLRAAKLADVGDLVLATVEHGTPARAICEYAGSHDVDLIALGRHAVGVMGNDSDLIDEVLEAGETTGQRCWELPLWDEYRKQLDSTTADLQNIGGREGSSVTAGCFLAEFVGDAKWVHLDIAGTAYGDGDSPYLRKGGYGLPTRLLVEWERGRTR